VLDEGIDPRKAAIVKRASPRTESPAAHAPGAASHAVSAQPPIGSAAHAISKVVRRPTDLSDDPERPKDAHSALFLAHEFYHRHVFMYGIHRATVPDSPVKLMYRPGGTETPAERALSETELKAFLLNCQSVCRTRGRGHILMTLLLTMQRRQELALAKKTEFDLEKRTWSIPDEHAKKGRGHVLPLSDWAVEEIRSLMGISRASPYLLPRKNGMKPINPMLITRSVERLAHRFQAVGIELFSPHDLRRTGRTGLASLGIEDEVAERVLNHQKTGSEAGL
jgi:integrase